MKFSRGRGARRGGGSGLKSRGLLSLVVSVAALKADLGRNTSGKYHPHRRRWSPRRLITDVTTSLEALQWWRQEFRPWYRVTPTLKGPTLDLFSRYVSSLTLAQHSHMINQPQDLAEHLSSILLKLGMIQLLSLTPHRVHFWN